MDIKKVIDKLTNKQQTTNNKKEESKFLPKNYTMKEIYDAEILVIGKLEYISSDRLLTNMFNSLFISK